MVAEDTVGDCPECGTRAREGARFCAACGASIPPAFTLPALDELSAPVGADAERLSVLEIQGLSYLGGLHDLSAVLRAVTLIIGEDGIGIYRRRRELLLIDDDLILALRVDEQGPDTVIEIHTHRGVGRFEGLLDSMDRSLLMPFVSRRPGVLAPPVVPPILERRAPAAPPMSGTPPAGPSAAERDAAPRDPYAFRRARLQELRALHDDGLIPQDEYQRRCAEIIAEI